MVEIDFGGNSGLTFSGASSGSSVFGLALGNSGGNGITLNSSNITLNANYIGIHADGSDFGNALDGIHINSTSSGNLIGLQSRGSSPASRPTSSRATAATASRCQGSSDNTIVGNHIGTDAAGTTAVANGQNGILITNGAHDNMIGGTVYVDSSTGQANDPTGNKGTIVPAGAGDAAARQPDLGQRRRRCPDPERRRRTTSLSGNFIGTDAAGTAAVGNGGDGVHIVNADGNSLIGCAFPYREPVRLLQHAERQRRQRRAHHELRQRRVIQANYLRHRRRQRDHGRQHPERHPGRRQFARTRTVGGVIPLGNVVGGGKQNGIYVTDTASGFTTFNTFGGLLALPGLRRPTATTASWSISTGGNNPDPHQRDVGQHLNNGIEIAGDAWA